jgi:hypothetical protein
LLHHSGVSLTLIQPSLIEINFTIFSIVPFASFTITDAGLVDLSLSTHSHKRWPRQHPWSRSLENRNTNTDQHNAVQEHYCRTGRGPFHGHC